MAHPIFQDPPSRDMSAAAERQVDLDDKIEAFLAQGGEIKAYDTLRRSIEPSQWSKFSIAPRRPAPVAAPKVEPEQIEQPVRSEVQAAPASVPQRLPRAKQPKPQSLNQDDERLAVKIIVAAALGESPRVIARGLHIPLRRCLSIAEQCHVRFHVGGGHAAQ